jgi:hypothetical protein
MIRASGVSGVRRRRRGAIVGRGATESPRGSLNEIFNESL